MSDTKWWQFWKWHIHRCTTESDETGCWGECITCHRRFGFVSYETLRAYIDRALESSLSKARGDARKEKP